jgi:Protein of unknown function (DUF3467)
MASKDGSEDVKDVSKATRTATTPKVVWDDSKMRTSYANVCNVLGTREEIMLLFGANQAWHGGQKEVTVALSDRIVLNPYAAKRLQQLLSQGLKDYESRYGELKL